MGGHAPAAAYYQYPAFSLPHLRDLGNEILLVSLPGLLALGGALFVAGRFVDPRDPMLRFLAVSSLSVHVFAATWNPEIGAYRDWDLFAITGFFDALLGAWVLVRFVPRDGQVLAIVLPTLALSLALTGSWIVSNSTRTIEVPSRHVRAHVYTGQRLWREGRLVDAMREYEEALAIGPRDPDALYEFGSARWNQRQFDRAEPLLRRFLQVETQGPRADRTRAVLDQFAEPRRKAQSAP